MSPRLVLQGGSAEALHEVDLGQLELVGRSCKLRDYSPKRIKNIAPFDITGEVIAYASPDSTYAVTRKLMDAAKKSIRIGIYDFTADYMKEILLNAIQRGVKVTLMLDIDSETEQGIMDELAKFGGEAVPAPSCASQHNSKFFRSAHEKFVVIDDEWVLVQSGNYSKASIPFNEKDGGDPDNFRKGNRDMGVAIRSKELAAFFTKVLRKDIKLELGPGGAESLAARPPRMRDVQLVEAVPKLIPSKLFPSKRFKPASALKMTPVLTPDNYMDEIPAFLASAKQSILIEQQYIHSFDEAVDALLSSIAVATGKNPGLDVRIILGKIFDGDKGIEKEAKNLANIRKKFNLRLGANIRFINTQRFTHCHNKLIVVDRKAVLVSSQNWSNAAVLENREAGLLMPYAQVARYFADIFESDWETAVKTLPKKSGPQTVGLESLATENLMEVSLGDYVRL
jgi:phosphatidylserine/phosphatidylglycerophosphate/cardiolipin synthase-like enzyme